MKPQAMCFCLLACLFAAYAGAQSLAEVAKKEKERRSKNKETEVEVITEADLGRRSKSGTYSSTGVPSSGGEVSSRPPSSSAETISEELEEGSEETAPASIPADASPQDKIAIFERMVSAHRAQVQKIDEEIAKNNARIEEIQQRLTTIGHGGLPTVPQADRSQRYEGEFLALQQEQAQLRQKNGTLEAQKKNMADELREKGRRAGIPAGYLRF